MNRVPPFLFSVIFLLLSLIHAQGQDYPMLHYTVEDGLPGNVVYCVYRDSKGYLWIATDKGVARYNGLKFENYSTFNGLPDNEIFFVQEDYYGRIWLGTFNGDLCYYKDGIFHTAANTPFLRIDNKEPHIRHVSNEADSSVIICYNNPLEVVVAGKDACKVLDLRKVKDTGIVNSVCFTRKITDNKYKLICTNKLVFIDSLYNVLSVESIDSQFFHQGYFASCQNQDYLYNDRGFFTMDLKPVKTCNNGFLRHFFLQELYVSGNDVFYATTRGLHINDSVHILKGENVSAVTQDRQGNYWVSTLGNGVFVFKKNYANTGYYGGIYKDKVKYSFTCNGRLFFITVNNDLFGLKGNGADCLFSQGDNNDGSKESSTDIGYFVGADHKYYNFCHTRMTVIDDLFTVKKVTYRESHGGVKEILVSGNYAYFRLPANLLRVSLKDIGGANAVRHSIGNRIAGERIFCMAGAPDSSVWYSTLKNVFRVTGDEDNGVPQSQFKGVTFKSFTFFGKYLVGYTHNNSLLVCKNVNSGSATIDTLATGNCIWDKFYKIDACHMLISTNEEYRLLTVDEGKDNLQFTTTLVEDPFVPLHPEAICMDDKSCYFFKNGSVTVIGKQDLLQGPGPPEVFFTFLRTGSKVYPVSGRLQLPFNESGSAAISFSSLSFGGRAVLSQYSISKDGTDNWRDVKGNEINLLNITPGDYVIKLRAKTLSSGYCQPVIFTLHVLRPFWLSWWFVTFICIGLAAIIGAMVRYRLLYALHKKEKEHETEIKFMKSEYKALNALMNPHFIFNTLNNVQGLVNRNDKLAANEYIRIFADLIRQNMHNVSKELIPLQKEIDLVANYLALEKLRFKEHLNYTINIEDGLDLSEIMVPPLLVQPLVENSIKHGILPLSSGDGKVIISIYERNSILSVEVRDNGIGILAAGEGKSASHESYGLENIRKRISQLSIILKKEILFDIGEQKESDNTQWTIVKISMPLTPGS